MKRILVPFDGSDAAHRAFEHAMQTVTPAGSTWLHLLNVQLPLVTPWPFPALDAAPFDAELQRQGLAVLADVEARAAAHCVPCELEVRIGKPEEAIVAAAEDNGCASIVVDEAWKEVDVSRLCRLTRVPVTLVR